VATGCASCEKPCRANPDGLITKICFVRAGRIVIKRRYDSPPDALRPIAGIVAKPCRRARHAMSKIQNDHDENSAGNHLRSLSQRFQQVAARVRLFSRSGFAIMR
jgi:hypothetical protein